MQRYFIEPKQIQDDQILLIGEPYHHLIKVLRSEVGDQFLCCDGQGIDYLAEIIDITPDTLACRVIKKTLSEGEPVVQVTVAQALPKGDKLEWIIQKGTEIGAHAFLPFSSQRTIVKLEPKKEAKKHARWQKIIAEAAEQAHRGRVPELLSHHSWKELLQRFSEYEEVWIAYEKGGIGLAPACEKSTGSTILLVIGPEGGFMEEEIVEAEAHGAKRITLGKRILRTETASLCALSAIFFANGEMS